ncbi:MAG: hypothetical protein WA139_01775 [Candidatus Aenigmatarchaeota archaeon]
MKKYIEIVVALAVVALVALSILVAIGMIQLPNSGAIRSQEQASQTIGDIGSNIEKIETNIGDIEKSLK